MSDMNNMTAHQLIEMLTSGIRNLTLEIEEVDVKNKPHAASKAKQCYTNAYRYIDKHYAEHGTFVLGYYIMHDLPIEHAWVKVGTQHFDVTLTPNPGDTYVKVIEVPKEMLYAFISQEGHAPDLYSLNRFAGMSKNKKT